MPLKQGYFIPQNPQKYINIKTRMNESEYPVYRSSWELKFFKYLDTCDSIKKWTSEPLGIKYIHPFDGKIHHYYPDFLIVRETPNGDIKILVEIKPKSQTLNPKSKYDKIQHTINLAKWDAAKKWCRENNTEFCILTERELSIK